MKKIIIPIILSITINSYSQNKNYFSAGIGSVHLYNDMLASYNFSGTAVNIDYFNDNTLKNNWKSMTDVNFFYSLQKLNEKFIDRFEYKPFVSIFNFDFKKNYVKRIYNHQKFSVFTGPFASINLNYQLYSSAYNYTSSSNFFKADISFGLYNYMEYCFKRIKINNYTSCTFFSMLLYPNYSYDLPLVTAGNVSNYFESATVNKKISFANKLQLEIPLYINKKFINSFTVFHTFYGNWYNIKDSRYREFGNNINVGVIFRIHKISEL